MPWFTKKERRRQVSAFPAIFKADFGRFRHVSAVFRPISAVSAAGRYDPIQPDFVRISPVRRESKPIRHESSRIGANRAESARIRNKKKKNRRHGPMRKQWRYAASDAGATPLVPRPCFLAHIFKWITPFKSLFFFLIYFHLSILILTL